MSLRCLTKKIVYLYICTLMHAVKTWPWHVSIFCGRICVLELTRQNKPVAATSLTCLDVRFDVRLPTDLTYSQASARAPRLTNLLIAQSAGCSFASCVNTLLQVKYLGPKKSLTYVTYMYHVASMHQWDFGVLHFALFDAYGIWTSIALVMSSSQTPQRGSDAVSNALLLFLPWRYLG